MQIFPNVIKEGRVDFDLLKQELSDYLIEGCKERYGLNWVGKRKSILKANTPIKKTLRPIKEKSVDFENTKNLYIEGDNFEALKIIQESYLNKVKMIYIDPPYNTGKDFIYKDRFAKSKEEYEEEIEVVDEEGMKLFKNTDSNGRFHSDWLSMMYERLLIARDLLKEDGVIFISIDDNEVHNLRHLCDEVFGEGNFLYQLTVVNNLNGNDNSTGMMETHEYCLIYAKNKEKFEFGVLPVDDELELEKWQIDEKGYYKQGRELKSTGINAPREKRPNLFFPIYINQDNLDFSLEKKDGYDYELFPIRENKEMSWTWSKEKFLQDKNEVIVKKTKEGYSLYKKQRPSLGKLPSKRGKTTFYSPSYSMANSNAYIKRLFNGIKMFDYPKPIELIKDFVRLANTKESDIILDFFSGSATSADATMQLNAEDGGNRQFIMVQIPEKVDEKSEAYKAGFRTIAEIGRERIIRAAKKIKEDFKDKEYINSLDFGFRYFKVDSSNFKEAKDISEITQENLFDTVDNIKPDRDDLDLLFEVMLNLGLELTLQIETKEILGKRVYFVEYNSLIVCFDNEIDENLAKELATYEPLKVVLRDSSFKTDSNKINFEETIKELSPDTDILVV